MDKHFAHQILEAAVTLFTGLLPGAIGAAVALAWERGLTWGQRFLQLAVGSAVSWFATRAIGGIWPLDSFVLQGIAFTFGMIAFKATPGFIAGAVAVVADLPAAIRDRYFPKGGRQ